jgi:hypothetical protein
VTRSRGSISTKTFGEQKHPTKLNKAQELSAYGAERKRPAGEMMCNEAAVKASQGEGSEKTAEVRLNSTSTESRCAA